MKVLVFMTFLFLLASCRREEGAQLTSIPLEQCFRTGTDDVRICFDSVLSDSRCPANVVCVWEGFAAAQFTLRRHGSSFPFALSTSRRAGLPYPNDTLIQGVYIRLADLRPYPGAPSEPARAVVEIGQ